MGELNKERIFFPFESNVSAHGHIIYNIWAYPFFKYTQNWANSNRPLVCGEFTVQQHMATPKASSHTCEMSKKFCWSIATAVWMTAIRKLLRERRDREKKTHKQNIRSKWCL